MAPHSFYIVLLHSLLFSSAVFASSNAKSLSNQQQCINGHFSALLHLKLGFRFSPHSFTKLSSWNPNNTDCCSWEGIRCDGIFTGHVVSLDLSGLNISGGIDSESLSRLRSLRRLNLARNDFDPSPFPSGLGQLTSLTHLDLSYLKFYGQIPLHLSRLTSLVSLDLSYNSCNDSLRLKLENPSVGELVQNLSSLRELHLDLVDLSAKGTEWVQALASSLPQLRKLSLFDCRLSGPIHSSLSKLSFLSELNLSLNNLSSVVPNFMANFSSLTLLRLAHCELHGEFPKDIFRLPKLQTLHVSSNPLLSVSWPEFSGNNTIEHLILSYTRFSAKLPHSLGNLKFLTELRLGSCNLSGPLPSFLVNLTKLEYLDLSFNNFIGPIPSAYGSELLNLEEIRLRDNLLSGTVPSLLFSIPSLRILDLRNNQLGGQLGKLHNASSSQLKEIYLSHNNLQGLIPKSFFQCRKVGGLFHQNPKKLLVLNLSYNNLSIDDGDGDGNSTSLCFLQMEYLSLRSCNVSIFPNFLRNQYRLKYLDLSDNTISGEIPKWIWMIGNGTLRSLDLSNNALQGIEPPFPHLLLRDLAVLDLSSNMLEGSVPTTPPSINFFSVSKNRLSGEIPLSICNATSLDVLNLSSNELTGGIPQCLGEISDVLSVLNLQGNALDGVLLQTFKEGCNLQTLDLSENQFKGQVPTSLANCKKLEILNLGTNQIHDTFPLWTKDLSQLRVLVLRSNRFYGPIASPLEDRSFPMLQIIDLSSNSFTGSLPEDLFQSWKVMTEEDKSQTKFFHKTGLARSNVVWYKDTLVVASKGLELKLTKVLTIFTGVDLSNNCFQGDIPESIGILKSLRVLNMSHNSFKGQIPRSLEKLTVLESLDLSQNKISGEIPWQLTKLTFLSVLNLSQNHLNGSIPQVRQFLTFTNESFQGNPELCGPPLTRKCGDVKGAKPSAFKDAALKSESEYDWEVMSIGLGIGFGVGMGAFFWTLTLWTKGRREYNRFIDGMFF